MRLDEQCVTTKTDWMLLSWYLNFTTFYTWLSSLIIRNLPHSAWKTFKQVEEQQETHSPDWRGLVSVPLEQQQHTYQIATPLWGSQTHRERGCRFHYKHSDPLTGTRTSLPGNIRRHIYLALVILNMYEWIAQQLLQIFYNDKLLKGGIHKKCIQKKVNSDLSHH